MMKIFTRNWLINCTSVILLTTGIAWACASDWDNEYGTSNFTPEVFVKNEYSPFFYSNMFYYKIGHVENQNTRFNEMNVSNWSDWLNHQIPDKELAFLLQRAMQSSIDSAVLFMNGRSGSIPGSMRGFTIFNRKNDRTMSFLNYLRLAKISEAFAVNEIQYEWDYDSTKKNRKFNTTSLNEELKKGMAGTNDSFLKERYWYQLTRSYFYTHDVQLLTGTFERYQKDMPRNTLYWRTLANVAGGYYRKKQFSQANYYYSLVYDHSETLKTAAHYSFHPQEEKDWKETLALCKNAAEQITLWQMLGVFYSDEDRSIREIYRLDPKSQKLNLLLARAINKYEQKFDINGQFQKLSVDSVSHYEDSLKQLILGIAKTGNTEKPWIWDMAAGYLSTLDGNYSKADDFYKKSSLIIPSEELAKDQLRLLKLINRVSAAKVADDKFENQNLADIRWLADVKGTDLRTDDALNWLKKTFAILYEKQGEWAKAQCFVSKTSFYADPENIERMKSFLGKSSKTSYEEFCVSLSEIKLNDIYEFEAIRLTYRDSIDAAIQKMNLAGKAGGSMLAGNPFNARIQDCHDCDFSAPQKIKYSKLSFLGKMKLLKAKIANGEDTFNNSLLLANAFYNLSQYGNARLFYECKILGESHSNPYMIEKEYRPALISMDQATKYYELTLSIAKTEEQKAKCQYLLAKCQRNLWYNLEVYNKSDESYGDDPMVSFSALDGFRELRKYPNTEYYKDVLRECGYFKTYMERNPPQQKTK